MLNYFQRRGDRACGALFIIRRDFIISENITGVVNHEQLLCACIISFQGNNFSMIKNVFYNNRFKTSETLKQMFSLFISYNYNL